MIKMKYQTRTVTDINEIARERIRNQGDFPYQFVQCLLKKRNGKYHEFLKSNNTKFQSKHRLVSKQDGFIS
jgi:uncharacterized protein (DUF342 family)